MIGAIESEFLTPLSPIDFTSICSINKVIYAGLVAPQ